MTTAQVRTRAAGLLLSLLLILYATLTPGTVAGLPGAGLSCLLCAPTAGADALLNITLFLPLGLMLGLRRQSVMRALLMGAALSGSIELLQYLQLTPGRVGSLADVATNMTGAAIGAWFGLNWSSWLKPAPALARVLAISSICCATLLLGFSGWALGYATATHGEAGAVSSTLAAVPSAGWFHGRVTQAEVDQRAFRKTGDGPLILSVNRSEKITGTILVSGKDERHEFVPMLFLHERDGFNPVLWVGQRTNDWQLHVATRAHRLKLNEPVLTLRDAVPASASNVRIGFSSTSRRWSLASDPGNGGMSAELPITLSIGWTLFQTVWGMDSQFAGLLSALWLLGIWMPVGYWCFAAASNNSGSSNARGVGRPAIILFAGASGILLVMMLVPYLASIELSSLLDLFTSFAGLLLGAALASRYCERFHNDSLTTSAHLS